MTTVREQTPRYAWVILAISMLACLTAPMNLQKVPGIASVLVPIFDLNMTSIGSLMSVFSIMGFAFAIPAGLIADRFGVKPVVLASLIFSLIGTIAGALSESFNMLLASRFVEGIGVGLIFVATPAAITAWFPPKRHGVALGAWGACMPLGTVLMLNLAPALALDFGWQSIWWFNAAFIALCIVLFAVLYKLPQASSAVQDTEYYEAQSQSANEQEQTKADEKNVKKERHRVLRQEFGNVNLWLAGLIFGLFNLVIVGGITSFYPSFLEGEVGLDIQTASMLTSIITALAIVVAPLVGVVSDALGRRKILLVLSNIGLALLMFFVFSVFNFATALIVVVLLALIGPISTTAVRILVPELTGNEPGRVSVGMSILALWQNLGVLVGPLIFGFVIDTMGWGLLGLAICVPVCAVMVIAAMMIKVDERGLRSKQVSVVELEKRQGENNGANC